MDDRNQLIQQWHAFKAGTECPAFGVFVDNGAEASDDQFGFVLAGRVTQSLGERPLYINGPVTVTANAPGECVAASGYVGYVAYNDTDGTPALGEVWGPVPNSYLVRKGFPGFKVLMAGANGIAWASYDPDGTYVGELTAELSGTGTVAMNAYSWSGTTWVNASISANVGLSIIGSNAGVSVAAVTLVLSRWMGAARRLEIVNFACSGS